MAKIDRIRRILIRHRRELRRKYRVREIGVFGSFVRNEQKKSSDIDILVDFIEVPGLFKYIELEDYLSDILGMKTDLVMRSALKPHIGRRVLSEVVYI